MAKIKNMRHFAEIAVTNTLQRHPDAQVMADEFIRNKASFGADWPSWCHLPMAATYAILTKGVDVSRASTVLGYEGGANELSVLTAALIWNKYKSVYRFDPTLVDELTEQPITGKLPIELLFRLPEPCIFIETDISVFDTQYSGFFAWLENDAGQEEATGPELRLLFLDRAGDVFSYPVILRESIDQSIEALVASAGRRQNVNFPAGIVSEVAKLMHGIILTAINMILYLCSEKPDVVGDMEWTPHEHKVERGTKSPGRPMYWDVGVRIGSALRKAKADSPATAEDQAETLENERERAVTRPHIRRAHWHHFWTGPLTGERRLVLRWLPPIPVNMDWETDNPTVVIRPVTKE